MTDRKKRHLTRITLTLQIATLCLIHAVLFTACSTTSGLPDDDQLFIGLSKILYQRGDSATTAAVADKNFLTTREEIEAALATAPNGALFGSSYYRTPLPYGLWIWNAFTGKEGAFAKWMTRSFGKQPVLMSRVNPELRTQVAQSILRSHGYFHGSVDYDIITRSNPKKAKIRYTVNTGPLLTVDTLEYVGFPSEADSLIHTTLPESKLKPGDAFTVAALDGERTRLSTLFRNSGYYYYQPTYTYYLADTLGQSRLRLQLAEDLPEEALRKYSIGHITVNLRKTFMQQLTDSLKRRSYTFNYSGRQTPLRPRVLMGALKLRPRQPYSYDQYLETLNALNATGLFSMTDFQFMPRAGSGLSDTLDLTVNCVFDRPYDVYVETNFTKRTIGRMGPQVKLGFVKRNTFHGGEKFDLNLHGSYEWQTHSSGEDMNTYEYGVDASLEFPRLVAPFMGTNQLRRRMERMRAKGLLRSGMQRRWRGTSTTLAKVSSDIVRRPSYYKMHIVAGEWTYRWQSSPTSRHEFSPLTVKYQFMNSHTERFDSILLSTPYLLATMSDYFIPQMRYTYSYVSPTGLRHPIHWEITLSEAGSLTSVAYMAAGKQWNEKEKKLFKNPYAQFVKFETDFTKTWQTSVHSRLVAHLNAGVGYSFGNATELPFSERFYVGGANSIRAFPLRTIGPGKFGGMSDYSRQVSYLLQNGDIKFQANLEYRPRLFGNLYGAVFLDAGNVWLFKDIDLGADDLNDFFQNTRFHADDFLRQLAVGTGIGLRYDLDYFVLRVDWGIGLHLPYETSRSGFYNIDRFSRHQTLHLAIGYPF